MLSNDSQVPSEIIPLLILICDQEATPRTLLVTTLERDGAVAEVKAAGTVESARELLLRSSINTIFVDPISLGLEAASRFVFEVRRDNPEIVFVLYVDRFKAEQNRTDFYRGERQRFSHYYTLDKGTRSPLCRTRFALSLRRVNST